MVANLVANLVGRLASKIGPSHELSASMKKLSPSSPSTETLRPLNRTDLDGAHGGFAQKTENCTNSIPCG